MQPTFRARRGWDRWRRFAWRHQVALALTWSGFVAAVVASPWVYRAAVPESLDVGATVALRSLAHARTFAAVERARAERAAGDAAGAERILERYLAEHADVQPGQLHTQAMGDASELLAELCAASGRTGKAHRVLKEATGRTPLNWWLWYLRGRAALAAGDLADATRALEEAFRQTLVVPEVLAAYLGVLAEQGLHEQVLWAFDQHERARTRCAPFVQAEAGPARSALQRKVLAWSGIPIEHGDFLGVLEVEGLPRGAHQELVLPGGLFARCPADADSYLQLCFQNLFAEVTVHAVTLEDATGGRTTVTLEPGQVARVARPHTGGDSYVEIHGRFSWAAAARVRVDYSTPALPVPDGVPALVANARRNVTARGGR